MRNGPAMIPHNHLNSCHQHEDDFSALRPPYLCRYTNEASNRVAPPAQEACLAALIAERATEGHSAEEEMKGKTSAA